MFFRRSRKGKLEWRAERDCLRPRGMRCAEVRRDRYKRFVSFKPQWLLRKGVLIPLCPEGGAEVKCSLADQGKGRAVWRAERDSNPR